MAVFQVDAPVLDADDGTDIPGLHVLDDQTRFRRMFGRFRLAPAGGHNIGSVAIRHPGNT